MKNSALGFSKLGFLGIARILGLVTLLAAGLIASALPLVARSRVFVGGGAPSFGGYRHSYPRYGFGFGYSHYRPFYRHSYFPAYPFFYHNPWPFFYSSSVFYRPSYIYRRPLPVYRPGYRLTYDDPPRRNASDDRSAWLRLDVQPSDASIYIDGQYAGKASEFSKGKKLLPVSPSDHTLRIEAKGYQPAVVDLKVNPLQTLDVLQHLRADSSPPATFSDSASPAPLADSSRSPKRSEPVLREPYSGRSRYSGSNEPRPTLAEKNSVPAPAATMTEPVPNGSPSPKAGPEKNDVAHFGTLIVKFDKPVGEAAVYIDGKFIGVTESNNAEFVVNGMPAGKHVVVVTKPGFGDFRSDVKMEENHSSTLNAALRQLGKR